jgi:acetyl-CoA carboxylase alpha subunit
VLPPVSAILLFLASAAFVFHHIALLVVVLHSSVATGTVAVVSGRGASGSALVVRVGGGMMVNDIAVGYRVYCHISALSMSWVVVAV